MQAGGEEDGNETPYADSDEEDLVEEVGSDGSSQLKPTSIQGMSAWPQDDREPLNAPGYIKMPDWPKTARRREMHEPPKPTKMSRFGSVMRCTRCHQVGHNKSSCAKNNAPAAGTSSAQPMETQSQQMVLSNTPGSSAQSKKRKAATVTTTSTTIQSRSKKSKNKAPNETQELVRVNASAKVSTEHGGSARVDLHAIVPHSQGSTTASVKVTSGRAFVLVSAQESSNSKAKKKFGGALLLMPPWQSDKL
uniref:CCHC-type domain-containing protein n=1 Tax=Oryza nivara TaxID=4536 RepID=A0A0E0HNE1_ORYNI